MPARRRRAASFNVLGVAESSDLRRSDQLQQATLALHERVPLDAFALEMNQIEREVDQTLSRRALRNRLLHRLETAASARKHHDEFAIDQPVRDAERADGFGDFRKPGRPVQPVPADQPDAPVRDHAADAIAIELDLMYPLVARRRCFGERCELRIVLGGCHVWTRGDSVAERTYVNAQPPLPTPKKCWKLVIGNWELTGFLTSCGSDKVER